MKVRHKPTKSNVMLANRRVTVWRTRVCWKTNYLERPSMTWKRWPMTGTKIVLCRVLSEAYSNTSHHRNRLVSRIVDFFLVLFFKFLYWFFWWFGNGVRECSFVSWPCSAIMRPFIVQIILNYLKFELSTTKVMSQSWKEMNFWIVLI